MKTTCQWIRKLIYGFNYYRRVSRGLHKSYFFCPWKNTYILWRMEVAFQMPPGEQGFLVFWKYVWRYRKEAWRFLDWAMQIENLKV